MPVRSSSTMGSDDVGDASDPLYARFKTWRHIVGNLLEYFDQVESMNKTHSKEFLKLSKTLEVPFKTPEFAADGITTIWQGMRDKAVQMSTFYQEEANILKAGVIAELTRLRADIKKHMHDLEKEGVQGSKKVGKKMDKFSDNSQSLGKWIPVAETNPTSLDAHHDPYVLWRLTRHKLYRAVDEENQFNEQLMSLQTRCQLFEAAIVRDIQKAIKDYTEAVTKESQYSSTVAAETNAIAMGIPPEREWEAFQNREPSLLKPDHKPRDPLTVPFPFSDHKLTQPVIEGRLERKSTVLKRRQPNHYVLTPSGFLLEYKDNDPVLNPEPNLSLKLADCALGPRGDGDGFTIRGKDAGKSLGVSRTHEYAFRTDNHGIANQWWDAISKYTSNAAVAETSSPISADNSAASSPISAGSASTGPQSPFSAGTNQPTSMHQQVPAQRQYAAPAATAHQPVQTETPMYSAPTSPVSPSHGNAAAPTAAPTSASHAQRAATTAAQETTHPATSRGTF